MGGKKVKAILIKSFKTAYRFRAVFTEKYNLRDLTITYTPSADSTCDVYVNDVKIHHTAKYMDYIIDEKDSSRSILNILINNIVTETLYQMHKDLADLIAFKKTNYYKVLRRDIRNMLLEYLDYRRESLMRDKFFKRIAVSTSLSRICEISNDHTESFAYFVVPLNGVYTTDVNEMILVKSDPRNGYRNIVHRTTNAIRNNDPSFDIFKKEQQIQLNKELTEDLIPYV